MNSELTLHGQTLVLHRFPKRVNDLLQAWDAGDEYLINHVQELDLSADKRILILNDSFGALSCWFSKQHHVTMMSDSFIAQQATLKNLQQNTDSNQMQRVNLLTTLDDIPQDVDLVLMKIPKNNRHLIWQLTQLRACLTPSCPVIAVNKAKEIHTATLARFDKYLGETTTSLAWKKHRLVFSSATTSHANPVSAYLEWSIEDETIRLKNLPNVYSGESLDLGARFLLQYLSSNLKYNHIIDLGCGNGVLSVKIGLLNPQAQLTCVDESFMAVESARQNLRTHFGEERLIQCSVNNCLDGFSKEQADLILCNPPFHQQLAITDHIAWQMFCDSKRVLKEGGELWVIGNRHLRYEHKLAKLFGQSHVKVIATNHKFVILQVTK